MRNIKTDVVHDAFFQYVSLFGAYLEACLFINLFKIKSLHWICRLLEALAWQRPILAGSDPPTTFGVLKLNCCVRHGNRCILQAIITTLPSSGESLCSQN